MDCSSPGSSVYGILQARILEWVAISISRGSSNPEMESESPVNSLPLSHGEAREEFFFFFFFLPFTEIRINSLGRKDEP